MPSKTKPKTTKANPDHRGTGDELHQSAGGHHAVLTTNQGLALSDNQNSLRATERGPTLLEDFILREKITHFDHERIPERIVHARGSAAHGYFELTKSLKKYSRARILTEVGERTPLFCRFSTVAGGAGSVDTPRDVRGFAVKFYSKDGNWDLVGNNIPVFFIQDAMKFPDVVHAVKMEPDRGFPQAGSAHDTFWDFISLTPEAMHNRPTTTTTGATCSKPSRAATSQNGNSRCSCSHRSAPTSFPSIISTRPSSFPKK